MDKIKLTKKEKEVLRLLASGIENTDCYPLHTLNSCVDSLERKGLAKGAWASGHEVVAAKITDKGKMYIALNPKLKNPTDTKWVITTVISAIGVTVAFVALFVACKASIS